MIFILDKPGPPNNLKVKEFTESSVTITYEEPDDDGGCEIQKYVIEKREASRSSWGNGMSSEEFEYTATKLVKGKQYYFRVAAVNEVGQGPFTELSEPVTAKSEFGKPVDLQISLLSNSINFVNIYYINH